MKNRIKRFFAILLVLALSAEICPQVQPEVRAAVSSATLTNLGNLGKLTVGNKTKQGNWWKMNVSGEEAFCMNLGYTCHRGDLYESGAGTYSSSDSGKKKWKAYIGYWFDIAQKRSNKAYVMAQALFWAVEEGDSSEAKLKAAIKTVQKNTGYYSSKTVDELYTQIFEKSGTIKVDVTEWKYCGSGSHRQQLLVIKAGSENRIKPKCLNATETYRQRITLYKTDEDGAPLSRVKFTLAAKNIDELYFFEARGFGETEQGDVAEDIKNFEISALTDADGMIAFRFNYHIQSEDYYYYNDDDLKKMSSSERKAAKEFLEDQGYKYGSDLSKGAAEDKVKRDIEKQMEQINNKYVLREDDTGNKNIVIDPEYKSGKTIVLGKANSWLKNSYSHEWPEVESGELADYKQAYKLHIQNNYKKIWVKVQKKDGYSKDEKAHGDASLDGAVFRIYQDEKCTKPAVLLNKHGQKIVEPDYFVKNGNFETDYMRCGRTYYLKEVKSPEGYRPNQKVIPIKEDGDRYSVEYSKEFEEIEVKNQPVLGKIAVQKFTSNGTTGPLNYEKGVKFQIYLKTKGSYSACGEYEKDTIVTDENGYASTKSLYYGTYIVHQVDTGEKDTEKVKDFEVVIHEDGKIYTFPLYDDLFKAYLKIVKKDGNTKKTVLKPGTAYQIYKVNPESGEEMLVTQSFSNGNKIEHLDHFRTDASGTVMTVKPLPSGTYRIYETDSAEGLNISTPYYEVKIDSRAENYTTETDSEGNIYTTVELSYINDETYGKLSIKKTGEQLIDYNQEDGKFIYENTFLKGAVFEIYAAADIMSQDNQNTHWFRRGEHVSTVTTGTGAVFSSTCGGITGYDMDEEGTVTVRLPLGKYRVVEKKTLYGYILPEKKEWNVEFTWRNKTEKFVLDSTGTTDDKGVLNVKNTRAGTSVAVIKEDADDGAAVRGAVFGLYTKDDIYNADGTRIVKAGTKLRELVTDEKGEAFSNMDLPLMSQGYESQKKEANSGDYYLKELSVSDSYYLDDEEIPVHLEYRNQETAVVSKKIKKTNRQTKAEIDKLSLKSGEAVSGCHLQIVDEQGNIIISWITGQCDSVVRTEQADELGYQNLKAEVNEEGNLIVGGLLQDTAYTLRETRPADGYVTADSICFKLTGDQEGKNQIVMYDDTTKVEFHKKDGVTGKLLDGARIAVYNSKGKEVYSFCTKKEKAECIEGILRAGETYLFRETAAPGGYEKAEDVSVTIKDAGEIQTVFMTDRRKERIEEEKTPKKGTPEASSDEVPKAKQDSDTSPETGDGMLWRFCLILMVLSGMILTTAWRKKRE